MLASVWATAQVRAQAPVATSASEQQEPPSSIVEAGGRLLVTSETVVVTAESERVPRESSLATKVDTPLRETPRTVSIVDRRTLDELAASNITQAHDYTVGVMPLDERGPASSRGFPIDFYDLRRDGLRTYSWSVREPVMLDRVQYLHGPASVLYGDGSPGGLVNLVVKKPLPVPQVAFAAAGGELGFGRVTGDVTGPLGPNPALRYRVVGAGEWLDNGFDNDERRLTLMPMVAFDVSPKATVTFDTELYQQQGRNYRHAVPATAETQRGDFSTTRWDLGAAAPDDGWHGSNVAPALRLDMALRPGMSLHVAGRYTKIDGDIDVQALVGRSTDGATLDRFQYREVSAWDELQTDSFATFTVRTGSWRHRLVTGVEAGLSSADTRVTVGPAPSLDIAAPVYAPRLAQPAPTAVRYDVGRFGAYLLDELKVGERLVLVPSLRWSHLQIDDRAASGSAADGRSLESDAGSSAWSPGLGIVVLPRSWLSLYATYTRGFEPPAPGSYTADGRALQPADNRMFEGGVKLDLARRLGLTAAAYRIERSNVAEADPTGFYTQVGGAESHGLEIEGVGTIARGIVLRGGYAWTSTEVTRGAAAALGHELPNAPHHKLDAWASYRRPDGAFSRLTLAGGVVHVTDRFTSTGNVVIAPAYTRIDATASYDVAGPRLTIALIGQNLADRRYVTSGAGNVLYAAAPRRIAVQLGTAF